MKHTIALFVASAVLTGCNPGWKTQVVPLTLSEKLVGVWMPKQFVEELRTTGKVDSRCAKYLEAPGQPLMDARMIDKNGELFAHDPDAAGSADDKMGKVSVDGSLKYSGIYEKQAEAFSAIVVSVEGDVLTMNYVAKEGAGLQATYLRSSDEEVRKDFEAQKACKPATPEPAPAPAPAPAEPVAPPAVEPAAP